LHTLYRLLLNRVPHARYPCDADVASSEDQRYPLGTRSLGTFIQIHPSKRALIIISGNYLQMMTPVVFFSLFLNNAVIFDLEFSLIQPSLSSSSARFFCSLKRIIVSSNRIVPAFSFFDCPLSLPYCSVRNSIVFALITSGAVYSALWLASGIISARKP